MLGLYEAFERRERVIFCLAVSPWWLFVRFSISLPMQQEYNATLFPIICNCNEMESYIKEFKEKKYY